MLLVNHKETKVLESSFYIEGHHYVLRTTLKITYKRTKNDSIGGMLGFYDPLFRDRPLKRLSRLSR